MEQRNIEQRYAIKFCVKLGDSVIEMYDKALSRAQVFRWYKILKMVVKASGMNREVGDQLKLELTTMFSVCALSCIKIGV
ncbi:Hypothetical protein CINCED_3A024983 [Cinara cedri]|uniref:Mos1 transposase HTH domain-containing protein n=1 Tax=Cinara cedri TaxID=506608 RepID=A0A5E4M7F1_9HEMI|nr:Hypothetical protein CINCED_3A024983 [Cinara cedri]